MKYYSEITKKTYDCAKDCIEDERKFMAAEEAKKKEEEKKLTDFKAKKAAAQKRIDDAQAKYKKAKEHCDEVEKKAEEMLHEALIELTKAGDERNQALADYKKEFGSKETEYSGGYFNDLLDSLFYLFRS